MQTLLPGDGRYGGGTKELKGPDFFALLSSTVGGMKKKSIRPGVRDIRGQRKLNQTLPLFSLSLPELQQVHLPDVTCDASLLCGESQVWGSSVHLSHCCCCCCEGRGSTVARVT